MIALPIDRASLPGVARHVVEREAWGVDALRVLEPHWARFACYVLDAGPIPAALTDIPAELLAAFSQHCDVDGAVAFSEAPLALAAVRLILLQCGYEVKALAALAAPRRRRRAANRGTTYHFEQVRGTETHEVDANCASQEARAAR